MQQEIQEQKFGEQSKQMTLTLHFCKMAKDQKGHIFYRTYCSVGQHYSCWRNHGCHEVK